MLRGIFWIDDGTRPGLESIVSRAAESYRARFHREPSLCLVPPGMLRGAPPRLGTLAVKPDASLPPHHIWIGIETLMPFKNPTSINRGNFRRPGPRRA